jgi:hypothetical protein
MAKGKFLYRAFFGNGAELTRNSNREYTHAWRVTWLRDGQPAELSGFAGSRELAEREARSTTSRINQVWSDARRKWIQRPADQRTATTEQVVHAMKL